MTISREFVSEWYRGGATLCLVTLSLSRSLTQFQFKCALLAWQKLYICIAKAIAAGLLTSSAHLN